MGSRLILLNKIVCFLSIGGDTTEYVYDANGNILNKTTGQLITEYAYNPDGLRVSKTVNGETTTHILDGSNVVADIKGGDISKYNRGRGLISMEQGGNKGYYMFNGHGDVIRIVNAAGTINYHKTYDSFGKNIYSENSDFDNPFGYAGEYTDEETDQVYLRARYYDPNTGRFTSEDPMRDGSNWYSYAGNNPVMFFDPTGYAITQADIDAYNSGRMSQDAWEYLHTADALWNSANSRDFTKKATARKMAVIARQSYDPNYVDDFDYTFGLGVSALDEGENGYYIKTKEGLLSNGSGGAVLRIVYERTTGPNGRSQLRLVNVSGESYAKTRSVEEANLDGSYGQIGLVQNQYGSFNESNQSSFFLETGFTASYDDGGANLFVVGAEATFNFRTKSGNIISLTINNNVYYDNYTDEQGTTHEDLTTPSNWMQGRGGGRGSR